MKKTLIVALTALFATGAMAAEQQPHWTYDGKEGPEHWAQLDPGYETCAIGHAQSPIDIRNATRAALPRIAFDYQASPAEVVNNGHTVQVNLANAGGIEIDGKPYRLVQFHFHTPSEEHIAGKAFPMVAHFVHQAADGRLAVVAVLFKEGAQNQALAQVFDAMPPKAGDKVELADSFTPQAVLPQQQGYYAFAGSLTTPPCSENVQWRVLKQPVELSHAQVLQFQHLYAMNARPIQALHDRQVLESDD
ncbi:MAG: carbonic anhydrase [Ectopseudomonas guguanensis]|uniref:carbonic anhydrase n=1 Tax=Ectopseudomonas guguanensis TaxID=1198456 RepID=UPI00391D2D82